MKNKKDKLLNDDGEAKISKLLTDLKIDEKHDALHDITVLESKLIELKISPKPINKIKKSMLSS